MKKIKNFLAIALLFSGCAVATDSGELDGLDGDVCVEMARYFDVPERPLEDHRALEDYQLPAELPFQLEEELPFAVKKAEKSRSSEAKMGRICSIVRKKGSNTDELVANPKILIAAALEGRKLVHGTELPKAADPRAEFRGLQRAIMTRPLSCLPAKP